MSDEPLHHVPISDESQIVMVRKSVREAVNRLGFGVTDVTRIVTAASELARNVFLYAGSGEMLWQALDTPRSIGIELVFRDQGPGIADINQALQEGYTTSGGLGLGLPGSKRLMDEFEIQSRPGAGTMVTVRKWRKK
jgi:serine/threonine-protein kinase RsbT